MAEQSNAQDHVDDGHGREERSIEAGEPREGEEDSSGKDARLRFDWGSSAPYISLQVAAIRRVDPRRYKNFKHGR